MANKRELKKIINYICQDLFSECVAASLYNNNKKDEINALSTSIVIIRNDYICRVSHIEPGIKPKAYFRNLKDEFTTQIEEITDTISNL